MRKTDLKNLTHRRSGQRVIRHNGEWYYRTREGRRGPFKTEAALRADLLAFVGTMEYIQENPSHLPGGIDSADVTVIDIDAPRF